MAIDDFENFQFVVVLAVYLCPEKLLARCFISLAENEDTLTIGETVC